MYRPRRGGARRAARRQLAAFARVALEPGRERATCASRSTRARSRTTTRTDAARDRTGRRAGDGRTLAATVTLEGDERDDRSRTTADRRRSRSRRDVDAARDDVHSTAPSTSASATRCSGGNGSSRVSGRTYGSPATTCGTQFAGWAIVVVVQDDRLAAGVPQRVPPPRRPARHRRRGAARELRLPLPRLGVRARRPLRVGARLRRRLARPRRPPLHEVRVDEWRGLVFVNLDADARALADDHAAFFAAADDQPIEEFSLQPPPVHDVAANWKVYCDNYGEGYHVPLVHPDAEPRDRRQGVPRRRRRPLLPPLRADARGAVNAGVWLWRYPNLALNIYPGGMNVERFVPVGHRVTQRGLRLLLPRPRRRATRTPRSCGWRATSSTRTG